MHRPYTITLLLFVMFVLLGSAQAVTTPVVFRSSQDPQALGLNYDGRLGERYLRIVLERLNITLPQGSIPGPNDPALHKPLLCINIRLRGDQGENSVELTSPGTWQHEGASPYWTFESQRDCLLDNGNYLIPNTCLNTWDVVTSIYLRDNYVEPKKANFMDKMVGLIAVALPILKTANTALGQSDVSVSGRTVDRLQAVADVWTAVRGNKPDEVKQNDLFDLRTVKWMADTPNTDQARIPRYLVMAGDGARGPELHDSFTTLAQADDYVTRCQGGPAFLFAYEMKESLLGTGVVSGDKADPTLRRAFNAVKPALDSDDPTSRLKASFAAAETVIGGKVDDGEYSIVEWGYLKRLFVRQVVQSLAGGDRPNPQVLGRAEEVLKPLFRGITSDQIAGYLDRTDDRIAAVDREMRQDLPAVALAAWVKTQSLQGVLRTTSPDKMVITAQGPETPEVPSTPDWQKALAALTDAGARQDLTPAAEVLYWLEVGQIGNPVRMMKMQPLTAQALAAQIARQHHKPFASLSKLDLRSLEADSRAGMAGFGGQ